MGETNSSSVAHVGYHIELYFKIRFNYRFDNTRGKTRDILILQRITKFSTTGSAGLKRRNNGRNMFIQCYGKIYGLWLTFLI
jgi:hypothetical protein